MNLNWKSTFRKRVAGIIWIAAFAGCQTGTPGVPGNPVTGVAVVTGVPVQRDGLVSVGDGIIAFGTTGGGVAYYRPGDGAATTIPGSFRGDAVYCCGTKVILVSTGPVNQVSVYDTTTGSTTAVPDTDVWDISPGARLENDNIAVDGNLVAVLHRGPAGKELKLIDVSGAAPAVTAFQQILNNAISVDVSVADNAVVVMEDNQFISVFAADGDENAIPQQADITTDAAVTIASAPKAKIGGGIVIFEESGTSIVFALRLSNGTIDSVDVKPAANTGSTRLECRGDRFAYFLNRNATDSDASQGSRHALAATNSLMGVSIGTGGLLGGGAKGGFGRSLALTNSAFRMYLAGRLGQSPGGGVNEPSYLQSSTGAGFFLLKDADDNSVLAADVVANDTLAAFKVVTESDEVRLGYYMPED